MTTTELFDKKLPLILDRDPAQAREVCARFHFKIAGAGTWTLDCVSTVPTCSQGIVGKADCTVEAAVADFDALLADPSTAMSLYFAGKLKVSGNIMLVAKLQKILES